MMKGEDFSVMLGSGHGLAGYHHQYGHLHSHPGIDAAAKPAETAMERPKDIAALLVILTQNV